jgi:type VI secretion system protein ImpJ
VGHPWGFDEIEVDRELLDGGAVGLSAARGLFPDGLPFDMPQADPLPEPRPLEDGWRPDQETMEVYLAISEYRVGGRNVSVDQESRDSRFSAEVVFQRDENTGQAEKPIQIARKNLRILLEGELLEGNAVLPIAKVIRTESGGYDLDPTFAPPLVNIRASSLLMSTARRVVELLSARSAELSGTRRQRGQGLADFGISDVANFWLLYTINTYLPTLRHLYEVSGGHPGKLYQTMLSLAGALTTFSQTVEPRDLPAYDHADLSGCFSALDERLRVLLETVVPQNYRSIPLRPVKAFVYAAALEATLLSARQIYLAVSAEVERTRLAEKVLELVKVGAADNLDHLYRRGLPGLELTHVESPPSAIPVKLDYEYFLVDTSGEEWQEVLSAKNLAAYVPAAIRDPALEVVALLPSSQ